MANDIDEFPLYDPLIKSGNLMSDVWVGIMSSFYMNLIGYLSQNGIFVPELTTVQIAQIVSPRKGQMVYNITVDAPQIFQN